MDIQEYIKSGILEQYCLGLLDAAQAGDVIRLSLLYPEIKQELTAVENAIEKLSASNAVTPNSGLKQKILGRLGFADEPLDINNLPATDKYSNHLSWLNAVEHLIPAEPFEDLSIQVLRQDDKIAQMLVVAKVDVPDESHEAYKESFFILKGTCECTVGDEIIQLNAGGFLEIPLHVEHNIKMLTPHVVAILQYQFI
jgi:mannose-6-phosphate isomerase-like protein (cupin superfamily)